MKDTFDDLEKQLEAFVNGITVGLKTAIQASPGLIKQHMYSVAKQKLDSTLDHWFFALNVGFEENLLIIELDPSDKFAGMLEDGAQGWDMKKTILTSKKAKTSKMGYKYMSVPIRSQPAGKVPGTDKGREFADQLNKILNNDPVFELTKMKSVAGATVTMEKLVTAEVKMQGFYRIRRFKNSEDAGQQKGMLSSQYTKFSTISTNPVSLTGATWKHPGLKAANVFGQAEIWLESVFPQIVFKIIEESVKKSMSY